MPNSTARTIVNTALLGIGCYAIPSDAAYTSLIPWLPGFSAAAAQGDKYQQQAVIWLNILHRTLGLVLNKRFMWREFAINLVANQQDYTVNKVIVEGFRANSFFNVTYGAGPGNPITVIPYERFMMMYARPDIIPIGSPYCLTPLPDDGSGNTIIRFTPIPDQAYTVKGQCRYMVPQIISGGDQIAFPPWYEDSLITKTMELLEGAMNEGRQPAMRQYAEQFVQEMMRDAAGADEEQDMIDMGVVLWNRWRSESARDYNPLTDVAGTYP